MRPKHGGGKPNWRLECPVCGRRTAENTGKSERTAQRAGLRGEKIGVDNLDKIAGTSLDQVVELHALAKMAPEDRDDLVARAAAGEEVSARSADIEIAALRMQAEMSGAETWRQLKHQIARGRAVPGNMTKHEGLDWLVKYGAVTRGYPQEAAAAYLGLGVQTFRDEVAAGRLPPPERYGKRLVWDKAALDQHKNRALDWEAASTPCSLHTSDPIMASINAAKTATVRTTRSS